MWDMLGRAKWCALCASSPSSAMAHTVAGTHGQSTRILTHTKQNGYMWMLS